MIIQKAILGKKYRNFGNEAYLKKLVVTKDRAILNYLKQNEGLDLKALELIIEGKRDEIKSLPDDLLISKNEKTELEIRKLNKKIEAVKYSILTSNFKNRNYYNADNLYLHQQREMCLLIQDIKILKRLSKTDY